MRLIHVRITNYKCILDSDEFTLGELTCLVGKNESGKTAILEAIEKINSARPDRANFKEIDFPRVLGEQDDEHERVITADFELEADEVDAIGELARHTRGDHGQPCDLGSWF